MWMLSLNIDNTGLQSLIIYPYSGPERMIYSSLFKKE